MIRSKAIIVGAVFFAGMILVSAADQHGAAGKSPVIKPRPTHAGTAKRQLPARPAAEQTQANNQKESAPIHRKARQHRGLVSRSAILSSSTERTLVPAGAVLHVPANYAKRVNHAHHGKLIGWQDFSNKNRNWIQTVAVTVDQASGIEPLTQEKLSALRKGGRVLIAVCHGGPISVNLPKNADGDADSPDPKAEAALAQAASDKATQQAQGIERLKRRLLHRAK